MNTKKENAPRLLTSKEFGALITITRDMHKWTQETLSELSRLNVRTIQRIEKGEPASVETKRALASAFGLEDIDQFNKPIKVQTPEEIESAKKKIEEEYVTLKATVINSGRQLAVLAEQMNANLFSCATVVKGSAELDLASLMDYAREYGESAELYSERDKIAVYSDFQSLIDNLKEANISLCCALRRGSFRNRSFEKSHSLPINTLYMVAFAKGDEPETLCVEKSLVIK